MRSVDEIHAVLGDDALHRALYWLTLNPTQKNAIAVCSWVRTVLFSAPYASVSFRSFAYWWLVSAGGGSARNCEACSSRNGRIVAYHGVCTDWPGCSCHCPGRIGPIPP